MKFKTMEIDKKSLAQVFRVNLSIFYIKTIFVVSVAESQNNSSSGLNINFTQIFCRKKWYIYTLIWRITYRL